MKVFNLILCAAVLAFGFGGTVLAKDHKVNMCHNGSTYNSDTMMEEDISFVISISGKGKAVQKHIENHGDCPGLFAENGTGQECELANNGVTVMCKEVTLCECVSP